MQLVRVGSIWSLEQPTGVTPKSKLVIITGCTDTDVYCFDMFWCKETQLPAVDMHHARRVPHRTVFQNSGMVGLSYCCRCEQLAWMFVPQHGQPESVEPVYICNRCNRSHRDSQLMPQEELLQRQLEAQWECRKPPIVEPETVHQICVLSSQRDGKALAAVNIGNSVVLKEAYEKSTGCQVYITPMSYFHTEADLDAHFNAELRAGGLAKLTAAEKKALGLEGQCAQSSCPKAL